MRLIQGILNMGSVKKIVAIKIKALMIKYKMYFQIIFKETF